MANATSPSPSKPKARAKAARKAGASKTRTKAQRAKAATRSGVKSAQTSTRANGPATDYAERVVLIPVGAALIARDRVVSTVSGTISTYSSTNKTQAQLRRFERRGATARNRLERQIRKARVRVERELRQRRRVLESTVSDIDVRRERIVKNTSDLANQVPDLANRVQERVLNIV